MNMLEKKRQDKIKTAAVLEKSIAEILVANGRSVEPFVKVFTYSGENVTQSPLGVLVGVFEIAEQSEDSAYIVNFLASVAKKEYFSNPRRGAIESFEAALHKINLALAELVKHGNIAWLGKLHGALGILEKNSLHFSVTGEAKILLLRNGGFSEISADLASEESHTHPIKTFVEVSSGHLMSQDKVIFTSPELLSLLPVENLEKNALRMDKEHFGQFLRTVLVNELDMAGAIVIDFQEGKPLPPLQKQEEKSAETTHNVFSQKAFVPKTKTPNTDAFQNEGAAKTPTPPEEYVDSKTGHIYIQGDTPRRIETNQNLERAKLSLQNMLHGLNTFFISQGKFLRRGKKYSLILLSHLAKEGTATARKTARVLRKQWRKRHPSKPSLPPQPVPIPQMIETIADSTHMEKKLETPLITTTDEVPPFMQAKLTAFYKKNGTSKLAISSGSLSEQRFKNDVSTTLSFVRKISQRNIAFLSSSGKRALPIIRMFSRRIFFLLRNLPSRKRHILMWGILSIIIFASGIFLLKRSSHNNSLPVAEAPRLPIEAPVFPLDTEKKAHLLEAPITLATRETTVVTSVLLNNETYLIAEKSIMSVGDNKQYMLPGNGSAQLSAPMDHLSLIFIYTDSGELFAWSPISRTFVKNTLTLSTEAVVKDIGTYLTYLYVLDGATDQIYRFPRAEGGFGQGSAWAKDSLVIEDTAKMATSETIFLAPNKNTVQAFFRGRFVKDLESPNTALSVTSLFTHPGLANIYALDVENKRVLIWNQDGVLIAQYFSDILANAKTITVSEKTSEILITTSNSLLSFKVNLEQ